MKKLNFTIILSFFMSLTIFSQINETFSDGNFTYNPLWGGDTDNFLVNGNSILQSNSSQAGVSYLSTPSKVFKNAEWRCQIKIDYNPSSSNYASFYIISDRPTLYPECNGYYVKVGGTKDRVSLFLQKGDKKVEIIKGKDDRTDKSAVNIEVKVTRDNNGKFTLYSKEEGETDFTLEGETTETTINHTMYSGVLVSNTKTTGTKFFFDNIVITGEAVIDEVAPIWTNLSIASPNSLLLQFSEPMDYSGATFQVSGGLGTPITTTPSADQTSVLLTFTENLKRKTVYTMSVDRLKDLSNNELGGVKDKKIGIGEPIREGDIVINEVLFNAATEGGEYVEFYNLSDKILDMSSLIFAKRKGEGKYSNEVTFANNTLLLPAQYIAISDKATAVKEYYQVYDTANVVRINSSLGLNNDTATIVIINTTKDTIFDAVTYNEAWHHKLLRNNKGVALERINPMLPSALSTSWHSASSEVHYGTPGYKNSQYRNIEKQTQTNDWAWVEPPVFTPDNDGIDDVCFIRYQMDDNGYSANVKIFNTVGVLVRNLVVNELLSTEGFLTWDGLSDKQQIVNAGVYVIYFEAINATTNKLQTVKLPIVVSAR